MSEQLVSPERHSNASEKNEGPMKNVSPASGLEHPTSEEIAGSGDRPERIASLNDPLQEGHGSPKEGHETKYIAHPFIFSGYDNNFRRVGSPAPSSPERITSSTDRDAELAKVKHEKVDCHIRAWEENEKAKALNKYNREISKIAAWENTKKATAQARLRQEEEKLERKKAAFVEKLNNEFARVHKEAEERRAVAEAKRDTMLLSVKRSRMDHSRTWELDSEAKYLRRYERKEAKIRAHESSKKSKAHSRFQEEEKHLHLRLQEITALINEELDVIYRRAEEKRGIAKSRQVEEFHKAAELAKQYRDCRQSPPKSCFNS